MLSGVGPSDHLEEHGVPIVKDLPGVGSHLVDHPSVNIRYKDKSGLAPRYLQIRSVRDGLYFLRAALQYFLFHTGPLAINVSSRLVFRPRFSFCVPHCFSGANAPHFFALTIDGCSPTMTIRKPFMTLRPAHKALIWKFVLCRWQTRTRPAASTGFQPLIFTRYYYGACTN